MGDGVMIRITDPDVLRWYGWGFDEHGNEKPVPSYVVAAEKLWNQWRLREVARLAKKEPQP